MLEEKKNKGIFWAQASKSQVQLDSVSFFKLSRYKIVKTHIGGVVLTLLNIAV